MKISPAKVSLDEVREHYCRVVPVPQRLIGQPVGGEQMHSVMQKTWHKLRPYIHLFGIEPDSAIAAKTAIARTRIILVRQSLGIPAFRVLPESASPEARRDIIRRLRNGATLKECEQKHGLQPATVKSIADSIGWTKKWRVRTWGSQRKTTFGKYSLSDVINMRRQGFSLSQIGDKINVTRERVRQILLREGEQPPTDRLQNDKVQRLLRIQKERAEVRARRRKEKEDRLRAVQCALDDVRKGVPMHVAAESNGISFSVLWYEITKIRRKCGAEALPYKTSLGGVSRPFPGKRSGAPRNRRRSPTQTQFYG